MTPNEPKQNSAARRALAVSIVMLLIWCLLGTHSTLTWFSDQKSAVNTFVYGKVKVEAEYWNTAYEEWKPLERTKELFQGSALYEPGYTQVARLKIKNVGDTTFQYQVAVTASDKEPVRSVLGNEILLSKYLKYGVAFADDETALNAMLANRTVARQISVDDMDDMVDTNTYYPDTQHETLDPGEEVYAALVVYMPEETDNRANAAGGGIPQVDLGVKVLAQQVTQ